MSVPTLSLRDLNRATLARQMLLERREAPVVEAVEHLGGLQAQEPRPPFLGLWSRLAGFDPEELREALHERRVVRAPYLRATLHLVGAADFLALRGSLGTAMAAALRVIGRRADGIDPEAVAEAAREALAGGPLAFSEIRPLLAARFPGADERGLGYAARTHMPLVMVPSAGPWGFAADAPVTPAESWLGAPVDPGDHRTALVCRYLAAFGPATVADLQAWSGAGGMAPVVEAMRADLVEVRDERGRVLVDLPGAPRPGGDVPAPARLLPDYDNLVLAHADRTRVVADDHRSALVTRNLRVRATLLVDGVVAGTWSTARAGRAVTLEMTPFARLSAADARDLRSEAQALLAVSDPGAARREVRITRPSAPGSRTA